MSWALTQSGFAQTLVEVMTKSRLRKVGFLAVSIFALIVFGSMAGQAIPRHRAAWPAPGAGGADARRSSWSTMRWWCCSRWASACFRRPRLWLLHRLRRGEGLCRRRHGEVRVIPILLALLAAIIVIAAFPG